MNLDARSLEVWRVRTDAVFQSLLRNSACSLGGGTLDLFNNYCNRRVRMCSWLGARRTAQCQFPFWFALVTLVFFSFESSSWVFPQPLQLDPWGQGICVSGHSAPSACCNRAL